ncbi:MAG: formate dehydrogenase accessory protein FdhE, partial [Anaerolineae bacterium]|nr:formate dehydrogenase accessory protein FdhE [Anaerolineae bacterium]
MTKERAQQVFRALSEAREGHPALRGLLDFYGALYQAQFALKEALPPATCPWDEEEAAARLGEGKPLLEFRHLGVTPEGFRESLEAICQVLVAHNPSWQNVCAVFPLEALLEEARRQFQNREALCAVTSVCAMSVTLALVPYAQRAADACRPLLREELWRRGTCPLCGGWPQFAFLERETGARRLYCARCDTGWAFDRVTCPFCGQVDAMCYYPSEDEVYRLYVCASCKRYLKTMDLRRTPRTPEPLVERLVTIGMDLAAQEQGY